MRIPYCIMSGSGNDFVVVDNREGVVDEDVCDRLNGIIKSENRDGLLLLEDSLKNNFKMRIINPDGSEAEMCGNGARCIAKFAKMQGIAGDKMNFETLAGEIQAEIIDSRVKIGMTDPGDILLNKELKLDDGTEIVHYINTGVAHTILMEEELEKIDIEGLGRAIRYHPDFQPQGTNVDFVSIFDTDTIKIRTYERGVEGETLACGTGAVAGACIAYLLGKVKSPAGAWTRGGEILKIYFDEIEGKITNLFLEGEVESIQEGEV